MVAQHPVAVGSDLFSRLARATAAIWARSSPAEGIALYADIFATEW